MQRDKEYILDILEAARKICHYTDGVTFKEFCANEEKQDAVIRRITIIGEATKRLSAEFRQNYPQIEWQEVAGMRDVVVHDYNRVNVRMVWDVVQQDIPQLMSVLTSLEE
ncbi:MAG: DUF86 domain-containing protein [Roseofilum sp. SBFL]|uniref:HepT-like ribonuclease domain-containing protein n=1 Tax=unclassified Roseofilum TaxID=2620099 RepID=UPI001B184428|nr:MULTISPECIES: DUF86 domain-containing protein [unclassified Roseofilum]MBP0014123.1 DUF86 domain-containing protein [Roseofilum sp. SID3]MBP0024206.1 DUF86 domain-containing protein [Roseofilum sp. SID2]MBP0042408.1 DUF86 domain-containing protein [Roseofilum sp. SBFL]